MGCSTTREVIESKMLLLKLRRIEIKKEREDRCKELSKLIGKEIIREPIKDYLIYPDDKQILKPQKNIFNKGKNPNDQLTNYEPNSLSEKRQRKPQIRKKNNSQKMINNQKIRINRPKYSSNSRDKSRYNNRRKDINNDNMTDGSDHYSNENITFKKDYNRTRKKRVEKINSYHNKENYYDSDEDHYEHHHPSHDNEKYDNHYNDQNVHQNDSYKDDEPYKNSEENYERLRGNRHSSRHRDDSIYGIRMRNRNDNRYDNYNNYSENDNEDYRRIQIQRRY